MAQPQQFQHQPYGSPISTPSPMTPGASNGFAPPATKRPVMSPNTPTAPYHQHQTLHSPPITNGNPAFQNPYAQHNANPYPLPNHSPLTQPPVRQTPPPQHPIQALQQQPQPQPQHQPAQPAGAMGTMGPPQKPEDDKNVDLNDITNVLTGAGVDLKAEEALTAMQGRRTTNYAHAGQPGHFDPQRNVSQANVPGGRDSFYGAGSFNQQAKTQQDLEDEAEAKLRLARRRQAERKQFHNNEPFLLQNVVIKKINSCAQKTQTQVSMDGVYHPQPNTTNKLLIVGPEGGERIATLTKEPLLTATAPMSDILALLSFACRERVRTTLEDSAAIVRGRRLTSHGIVPPDFQDIAVGQGNPKEATAEPVPAIGEGSPDRNSRKRSHSQANDLPTPVSNADPAPAESQPVPTIAYPDLLTLAWQKQAEKEERWEAERLAKRQRRATAKLISSGDPSSRANSVSGTPGPGTPGGPADSIAPDQGKLTKKEAKKKQDLQAQTSQAKDTASAVNMALGGKKLSWMTGGKAGSGGIGSGTSFGKRTPAGTPSKKTDKAATQGTAGTGGAAAAAAAPAKPKGLGGFREDREDGSGIQMRDLVAVLKDHNPEKRTLSKAFGRLNTR